MLRLSKLRPHSLRLSKMSPHSLRLSRLRPYRLRLSRSKAGRAEWGGGSSTKLYTPLRVVKKWTEKSVRPLELIHLVTGLGIPSATHSTVTSSPALTRTSFGSLTHVGGTAK